MYYRGGDEIMKKFISLMIVVSILDVELLRMSIL